MDNEKRKEAEIKERQRIYSLKRYHRMKVDPTWFEKEKIRKRLHDRKKYLLNPEKYRKEVSERSKRLRKKNGPYKIDPVKMKCRRKTRTAIELGKLVRLSICERCGIKDRINAHHSDYSKPLKVEWLCFRCHAEEHRKWKD